MLLALYSYKQKSNDESVSGYSAENGACRDAITYMHTYTGVHLGRQA